MAPSLVGHLATHASTLMPEPTLASRPPTISSPRSSLCSRGREAGATPRGITSRGFLASPPAPCSVPCSASRTTGYLRDIRSTPGCFGQHRAGSRRCERHRDCSNQSVAPRRQSVRWTLTGWQADKEKDKKVDIERRGHHFRRERPASAAGCSPLRLGQKQVL